MYKKIFIRHLDRRSGTALFHLVNGLLAHRQTVSIKPTYEELNILGKNLKIFCENYDKILSTQLRKMYKIMNILAIG